MVRTLKHIVWIGCFLGFSAITFTSQAKPTFWQSLTSPIDGLSESIGGYSNGCIIGAKPLNNNSEHYQILRMQNNRYYGHPELIRYIEDFTNRVNMKSLGWVLIGDMSMPGGGRFDSGHASHQSGLDVDIWLQLPKSPWHEEKLKHPTPLSLVNDDNRTIIKEKWQKSIYDLIKIAASDERVARIFVNPAIKKQLCIDATLFGENDRTWLRNVRPWHYHQYHMHIRLNCPVGEPDCQNQAPIPAGDGCGNELESWFNPKEKSTNENQTDDKQNKTPAIPERCELIRQHFSE
ncbi:penicillin-insensitive murein endopeptidase [Thorsellia anophelis]|nr:penicillin-insensitive murein endopeptidase [Thorsellia anophelis]